MTMLKSAFAGLVLALISSSAFAQSGCSLIVFGAVLTAGQWNECFMQKQDALTFTPINKAGDSMLGRLTTIPATAGAAGFNVGQTAVPPVSPVNGDMWITAAGLFVQYNGVTAGPFSSLGTQGTPASQDTAATLTTTQMRSGILTSNPAGAINLQLPLATTMDSALPQAAANNSFDLSVINTNGSNSPTITTNTGWTLVGNMVVATNASGKFRARKTGTGTWTLYRI